MSTTCTRNDVEAAVQVTFPQSDATTILGILDLYGTEPYEREKERVQLAIIELSTGEEDKLRYFLRVAKTDYRDVLHWQASGPLTADEGKKQQQEAQHLIDRWGA